MILSVRLGSLPDSVTTFLPLFMLLLFEMRNQFPRSGLPRTTILAQEGEEGLSASHPLFYVQERSKYLQRLVSQTEVQCELPTNDLRRNLRVDHYLNEYNNIRAQQ